MPEQLVLTWAVAFSHQSMLFAAARSRDKLGKGEKLGRRKKILFLYSTLGVVRHLFERRTQSVDCPSEPWDPALPSRATCS